MISTVCTANTDALTCRYMNCRNGILRLMKQPHDTNILLGMQTILPYDLHIQLLDSEIF